MSLKGEEEEEEGQEEDEKIGAIDYYYL